MKVVIIEDERLASNRLQKLLTDIDNSIEVIRVLPSVKESIMFYKQSEAEPDLSIMDIQLSDGSSFEIFDHVEFQHPVIFTTAFDQYAIDAFKVNAIDYLLKPIKRDALKVAIHRAASLHASLLTSELVARLRSNKNKQRFLIKFGGQLKLIHVSEIAYFFIEDRITLIMTKAGKRYPVDETLDSLNLKLDGNEFFRLNRQFIAHIDAIDKMYSLSKAKIKIILTPPTSSEIIVSTEKSADFKEWLDG